jgi:sRNA-binding protein
VHNEVHRYHARQRESEYSCEEWMGDSEGPCGIRVPGRRDVKDADRKAIDGLLNALAAMFPCFSREDRRPLKKGIAEDILHHMPDVDPKVLHKSLRYWTRHRQYLANCRAGEVRVALDGSAAGVVTPEDAEFASRTLAEVDERRRAKKTEKVVKIEPSDVPAPKVEPVVTESKQKYTPQGVNAAKPRLGLKFAAA